MLVETWPADAKERWPNFTEAEMACKCGCGALPDAPFMDFLQAVRWQVSFGMTITSGARCPAYNQRVSSTGLNGPHTTGLASDIAVFGKRTHALLNAAYSLGATGVGDKQWGPYKDRFIHLDIIVDHDKRPWKWSYH